MVESISPSMNHHSTSRRGGRTGVQRRLAPSPVQRPSIVAAKAAAAAKAMVHRAQENKQQRDNKPMRGSNTRVNRPTDLKAGVFRKSPPSVSGGDDRGGSTPKQRSNGHNGTSSTSRGREKPPAAHAEDRTMPLHHNSSTAYPLHPSSRVSEAYPLHAPYPYPPPPPGYPQHPHHFPPMHQHPPHEHNMYHASSDGREYGYHHNSHSHTPPSVAEYSPHHYHSHHLSQEGERNNVHERASNNEQQLHSNISENPINSPPPTSTSRSKSAKKVGVEKERPPTSNSTHYVVGSHTPIHVPRGAYRHELEEEEEEEEPLPFHQRKGFSGAGSVFRTTSSSSQPCIDEDNAHKILLSLSKSFEQSPRKSPLALGVVNSSTKAVGDVTSRPDSPHEPPMIQHWHRHKSDSFEPQPSPSNLSCIRDVDGANNNIDMSSSSFVLFNESFDANLEGILGPNPSFGLGPMRSLSFGLGLGRSFGLGGARTWDQEDGGSGLVKSPLAKDRGQTTAEAGESPHGRAEQVDLDNNAVSENTAPPSTCEQHRQHEQHPSSEIERIHFDVMLAHSTLFTAFSYLLPGARAVFDMSFNSSSKVNVPLAGKEREVARRRVNSALCAFGGGAVTPSDLKMLPQFQNSCRECRYEEQIPQRFFEGENRLSWEIEDEPPKQISDCDNGMHLVGRGSCEESMQRTIGVMVYPAVNAFTASEPGVITPALNEMNNFIDSKHVLPEKTPSKLQTELSSNGAKAPLPMVTPDSMRSGSQPSENKSFGTKRKSTQQSMNYAGGVWMSNQSPSRMVSPGKVSEDTGSDLLFVDADELTAEQYRIVTQKRRKLCCSRYNYPALPLPYGQRKRISNAMFATSKRIPGLTDECASVLGEARKKDAWDFAVAQLMTQVIILTHCSAEDTCLDGLSKYLLTLGIAC